MKRMRKLMYVLMTLLIVFGLAGCSTTINNNTPEKTTQEITKKTTEKSVLITSIPPVADIAEHIAGDKFEVYSIVKENGNPEEYEISTQDLKELADAKAYFVNGEFNFEKQYLATIKEKYPELALVKINEGIELLKMEEAHEDHEHEEAHEDHKHEEAHEDHKHEEAHEDHEHEESFGGHHHHHGEFDPHYWLSAENVKIIAQNITNYLGENDKENAKYYTTNLENFIAELATIHSDTETHEGEHWYIYHPSIRYFTAENNIELTAFQEEGKEATINSIEKILENFDTENDFVLVDQQAPQSFLDYLENKNIEIVRFNPIKKNIVENLNNLSKLIK